MPAIISEIRYRNGPNFPPDQDYIEIRVPTGTDISDLTVEVYNNDGTLRSTDVVGNGAMTTVGNFDYYVVSARINRNGAVSLVENNSVVSFVSFDAVVTATEGAADGTTSTQVGSTGSDDTSSLRSTDGVNFFVENNPIPGAPCFTAGTQILTVDGPVCVEDLKTGSLVLTASGQAKIVRMILSRTIGRAELLKQPRLRPVRILTGALGSGLPKRDLLVSRQHRMLVQSKIAQRMFGTADVLISAVRLTKLPGIFVDDTVGEVTYIHLIFDRHEVVYAEGAPSESLFTGPEALNAMSKPAREELLTLFPQLQSDGHLTKPAFYIPSGRRQKKLVARHVRNSKAIMDQALF